jgi:hypothetical protein
VVWWGLFAGQQRLPVRSSDEVDGGAGLLLPIVDTLARP